MTRIICPKCDASLDQPAAFEAHMESEHAHEHPSVGFGHTLSP